VEILISFDEIGLVAENGWKDLGVDIWEPMTGTSSPASPSRFLIVTLDGRYLALDAESIGGLLTLEEAGHVTHPTLQGMEYRAVDLADRLSMSHDRNEADTRIILLSEHGVRGSIRVTTVEGFLELQPSEILPLPMQFRGPERHWYRGMILFEKSIALILNPTWVLGEHARSDAGHKPGAPRSLMDAWSSAAREERAC
jgi:hypothetical protein